MSEEWRPVFDRYKGRYSDGFDRVKEYRFRYNDGPVSIYKLSDASPYANLIGLEFVEIEK